MCKHILKEIYKFDQTIDGLRKKNGYWEFALETCYGDLEWFSIQQAPERVEKYIRALSKIDEY